MLAAAAAHERIAMEVSSVGLATCGCCAIGCANSPRYHGLATLESVQQLIAALLTAVLLLLEELFLQLISISRRFTADTAAYVTVLLLLAVTRVIACRQACYSAICTLSMPSWVLHGSITDAKGFLRMFILGSGILIGYWCRYGGAAENMTVLTNAAEGRPLHTHMCSGYMQTALHA
jgi:hypothetical protein